MAATTAAKAPRKPPPAPTYFVTSIPSASARKTVLNGLMAYNSKHAGPARWKNLAVFLRDKRGRVQGGLLGYSFWSWAHIELLWLPDELRRQGHGRKLIALAEEEARKRGCIGITLDTTSFQAPDFYPKLGFKVYATIEDYPPGHRRFYLIKLLKA
jgi:ribosomal protein S18 acetylase RimI-like enzyme